MSRLYEYSIQYHKIHTFEEIQELYRIYRLTYGNSPIKFVREKGSEDNYHGDYGLCAAVIAEAQKLKAMGAGKIAFSTIPEKEARQNGGYSYRVCKGHNRAGTDYDPCRSSDRDSYITGSRS